MSDRLSSEDIATAVRSASENVFSTMLHLPLKFDPYFEEATEPASLDGVVALVGIAGSWTGTGRISCSPRFACQLAAALLTQPYDAVDEDVLDAVAEIANMIVGNVKTTFEETLGPLGLNIPTVIFGRNYRTRSSGIPKWTVVPFHCGEEPWTISFCFVPAKIHAAPHIRTEQHCLSNMS